MTPEVPPLGPEDPRNQQIEKIHEAQYRAVLGRIKRFSIVAWIVFSVGVLVADGWWALLGLTCSGLVVMINFLWLEEIVERTLQPVPQVKSWRVFVRVLARFALLGVALAVTIAVARFEAISVILGFSIVVAGIMGEAAYSVVRSFDEDVE